MIARANPLPPEDNHDPNLLPLGWQHSSELPFGFAAASRAYQPAADPLMYAGDGHLATFAPTGEGKSVSVIIPTLLTSLRSMIVLDLKGELYRVTARRRRELGQKVFAIDPFGIVEKDSHGLNPFDLLQLPGVDFESEAMMLADTLSNGQKSLKDRFWDLHGTALVSGLIAHFARVADQQQRHMLSVRDMMLTFDPFQKIAALLDSQTVTSSLAYRELAGFLNQADRETRPSVLATATSYLKPFSSDRIGPSLKSSSLKLEELMSGEPMTVYFIFPLDKLESHAGLLRMWLSVLMSTILRRQHRLPVRTLFLLDECAQLGKFQLLKPLITLCRGYGLQAWLFFQSLAQLKSEYPEDWRTILDNLAVVQAFGFRNAFAAQDWGWFFGRDPEQLLNLPADEQLVHIAREGTRQSRRMNYLRDKMFAGLFDPNPLCEDLPKRPEQPPPKAGPEEGPTPWRNGL